MHLPNISRVVSASGVLNAYGWQHAVFLFLFPYDGNKLFRIVLYGFIINFNVIELVILCPHLVQVSIIMVCFPEFDYTGLRQELHSAQTQYNHSFPFFRKKY